MDFKRFSQTINVFHGKATPEPGNLVGYGALLEALKLPLPMPNRLAIISEKRKQYTTENWIVLTPRHQPEETLLGHLIFAIKYEGINLLFFKKLFENLDAGLIEAWIKQEPLSIYGRSIWFLYEWLLKKPLAIANLETGNYVKLIDDQLQYCSPTMTRLDRYRILNNLPGTVDFCPLIHKTSKLENYINENLSVKTNAVMNGVHKDILLRTAAFLLLKDSKASFNIEGETPTQNRAVRWGRAIGQAGSKPLNKEEILRLQQIIIENSRFLQMGYRTQGGFIGEHDRSTGEPIPEHISARWQDVDALMAGLLETTKQLESSHFHPVLAAAKIAFGFVFIHPLEDGNGRLHRYLIHHLLSSMRFTPEGLIFPVSSAILERIETYRKVLESYSHPLLDLIEWKKTGNNNVEVLNDTKDYYRYFDATLQAEFLFECVAFTINKIIPEEIEYLQKYDEMKAWLDDRFQMPDKMVALLIRFLTQGNGILSKRAKDKEFEGLTQDEVEEIETQYNGIFKI